jgi:hypothetical protein
VKRSIMRCTKSYPFDGMSTRQLKVTVTVTVMAVMRPRLMCQSTVVSFVSLSGALPRCGSGLALVWQRPWISRGNVVCYQLVPKFNN